MAEGANSIEMLLKISAIVQGMGAVKQLGTTLKEGAKQAGVANMGFMAMAKSAAAVTLGFKGIMGAMDFMKSAIAEADAGLKAEQKLGAAIQRRGDLAKEAARKGVTLESQSKALGELADQMERAGIIASTDLKSGFAGLIGIGFSPKRIKDVSKGYEGLSIALQGTGVGAEGLAQVNAQIKQIIKLGGKAKLPAEWKQIASKEQIERYKKLKSGTEAVAWVQELMAKNEWRTAAALETTEGKLKQADMAWARMQETLGRPFAKTRLAFAQASGKLADALAPASEKIAGLLTPQLEKFAGWIEKQGPNIASFGDRVADGFQWVIDHWEVVSKGLAAIGAGLGTFAVVSILTNPITLFIGALTMLAGAIVLVVDNWGKIEPAVTAAWNAINTNFIQPVTNALKPIWEPIVKGAQAIGGQLAGPLGDIVGQIQDYFKGDIDWTELWAGLKDSFADIGDIFASFDWSKLGTDIFNGVKTAFASIDWKAVGAAVKTAATTALSNALTFGSMAIQGTMDFAGWVGTQLSNVPWSELAGNIGTSLGNAIKGLSWASYLTLAPMFDSLKSSVSNITWDDVGTAVINGIGTAISAAISIGKFYNEVSTSLIKGFAESLTGSSWAELGTACVNGFNTALTSIISAVSSWGGQIVQAIVSGMGGLGAAIQAKADAALHAVSFGMLGKAEAAHKQLGGLVANPTYAMLGERGPEMVIPLGGGSRSRGMLAQTAQMLGMGTAGKGGGGATNVSVNIPITVSGAPMGQEGAIGREIERAMQDPIKTMLEQLRQARDEEHRMAYV